MKVLFALFSILMIGNNAISQNTFPSSGNVGIGTTSPTEKLDINGVLRVGTLDDQAVIVLGNRNQGTGYYDTGIYRGSISSLSQGNYLNLSAYGGIAFNASANAFGSQANRMTISAATGYVGIGTSSPSTQLDVRGTVSVPEIAFRNDDGGDDSDPYRLRKVRTAFNENWLELQLNDDGNESFRIYGNSCQGYSCGPYSNNLYHSFDASGNAYHQGNLAIGTTNPQGYKLAVAGSMITESIKVKLAGNWPDYVFSKNHSLLSLGDLEKYIQTNKHLPEIPSTEEVKKDGIELGEMNAKLLKKIEELTLYLIEQNKELKRQQEQLNTQQNEILSLKNTIKNP